MQKNRFSAFMGNFLRFYVLVNLGAMAAVMITALASLLLSLLYNFLVEKFYVSSQAKLLLTLSTILTVLAVVAAVAAMVAAIVLLYRVWRKHLTPGVPRMLGGILLVLTALFTVLMFFADGAVDGTLMRYFLIAIFPFFPLMILSALGGTWIVAAFAGILLTAEMVYATFLLKQKPSFKRLVPFLLCIAFLLACSGHLYANRPEVRYGGHGFKYMSGYSSTDFTDYTVFSDSGRLAELDEPAKLQISEDMPTLDGAEACYPLYSAVAKAVYVGIEDIEAKFYAAHGFDQVWDDGYEHCKLNGEIVQFSNTVEGFTRLIDGEIDLFFGAKPSPKELEWARDENIALEITPIGKEGFVFFVEEDNPVDNLTTAQVKDIYAGNITNWAEVGGKDQEIVAFQRPRNSGSQTMMEYFMGSTPLRDPKTYETVDAMVGVIHEVAEYNNEAGAMGYTFRYFLEGLTQETGVKILAIDGVRPTVENIENGAYPIVADLCLITRGEDPNPNVRAMIDFMRSPQGQELVEKTGYAPLE